MYILSNRLAMEVLSNDLLLFVRTSAVGVHRKVYIPRMVVQLSLAYKNSLKRLLTESPGEVVMTTLNEWVISITSFRRKRYMCYTKMDANGDRIG